ncbi:hypothetical protein D9611_009797 [Ephemerocybe angulata]|uniref:Adenosine deaminase domain-containing protein n=1 Tax=Ephemerocybe angulata TaxID=980116 RepID=A0A8H5CF96_9AGAR|nr:hypothetical protein D9611_009797 [Tulosesus angulatus]
MPSSEISGPAEAALASLTSSQVSFLQSLPKAELHAHLNGSIPISILEDLAHEFISSQGNALDLTESTEMLKAIERFKRGHELKEILDFFGLFPMIYKLTSTPDALRRVTKAVLSDFLDGDRPQCTYLELRTGPRKTDAMSREEYMRAVLEEVERYDEDKVGLIMTLDRRTGPDFWEECLDIALKMKNEGRRLLGVDLAGDPTKSDVALFDTFFAEARKAGLGITLHIAETLENTPEETLQLLSYRPDRLGHATFLNQEAMQIVMKDNAPIEICLTSNLLCKTATDLDNHHIQQYLKCNHPVAICTDDTLPFRTNLLAEYALLFAARPLGLGLSEDEVRRVAEMSMESRFVELLKVKDTSKS